MTVRPGRAAVLALACVFTSSCVSTNSHSSPPPAATPVAPISTTGPTPGHWHAAWTRTLSVVPAEGEIRDLALVGGVLVAASPQGVEALDARTGTTVWRSDSFDRSGVAAFAVSGRQVVIATRGGRWISVQAPTGRVSWRSQAPSGALIPYSDGLQILAASAAVPVASLDTNIIRGIDGQTGRTKWNIGPPQLYGCTPDTSRLTQPGSVETKRYVSKNWLAIPVTCGTQDAVVAVNAATGRAVWRHGTLKSGDAPRPAASDRFIGINDDGYGVFEQGNKKDSHSLVVQEPTGATKAILNRAEAYDVWGPLSPLATVGSNMILPFVRHGKHYFTSMTTGGTRPSVMSLTEGVRVAAFDGVRAYGVQQDGSIRVASAGQKSQAAVRVGLKGKAFWVAVGNNSLFVAGVDGSSGSGRVAIESIGG